MVGPQSQSFPQEIVIESVFICEGIKLTVIIVTDQGRRLVIVGEVKEDGVNLPREEVY